MLDETHIKKYLPNYTGGIPVENLVYGLRTQLLFERLVRTIGCVNDIKLVDEDGTSGLPDYRISVNSGIDIFIEVKNINNKDSKNYVTAHKVEYLDTLKKYSAANNGDFILALYWNNWNQWTLNSVDDFKISGNKCSISFINAIRSNKSYLIGDYILGIKNSIKLEIDCIKNDKKSGSSYIVIDTKLSIGGLTMNSDQEKRISYFIFKYCNWDESIMKIEDGLSFKLIITKEKEDEGNGGFSMAGWISSLFTKQYKFATLDDYGNVASISPELPLTEINELLISPKTHANLPMWMFRIKT